MEFKYATRSSFGDIKIIVSSAAILPGALKVKAVLVHCHVFFRHFITGRQLLKFPAGFPGTKISLNQVFSERKDLLP